MEKENMLKTLPKVPIQAQKPEPECKTPIPAQQQHQNKDRNSSNELRKPVTVTPDHLRVPKAFKYPERYLYTIINGEQCFYIILGIRNSPIIYNIFLN